MVSDVNNHSWTFVRGLQSLTSNPVQWSSQPSAWSTSVFGATHRCYAGSEDPRFRSVQHQGYPAFVAYIKIIFGNLACEELWGSLFLHSVASILPEMSCSHKFMMMLSKSLLVFEEVLIKNISVFNILTEDG